jgi:hypothetical protein
MPGPQDYRRTAAQIASYLAANQGQDGAFPGPDHYGLSFSIWLWSSLGDRFAPYLARAWQRLQRDPPQTHGEFNAYALLGCRQALGPSEADAVLRQIPFGRRHSANWMLLRAVCCSYPEPSPAPLLSRLEAFLALLRYARRGLICDRPGVRSFAYHTFCGVLLADLWQRRRLPWAGRAAVRAADFILPFILPNGDTLYVGRGQQQIFGYAALLCLLQAAAHLTGRPEFREGADRAFAFLLRFQRSDGSFPLVLNEHEPPDPWQPDPSLPGWYTYNRYADYLPFLACFLLKAASIDLPPLGAVRSPPPHPAFRAWRQPRYTAVLARSGGAPTNDLPFPYTCVDGESLFPCYGGEGGDAAPETVPLPYGTLAGGRAYPFRDRLRYRLTGTGLSGRSGLVEHVRRFDFRPDGFTCRDDIMFLGPCAFSAFVPANFLFRNLRSLPDGAFETRQGAARALVRLDPPGSVVPHAATTASGTLVALRLGPHQSQFSSGDATSVELRVRFQ